MIYESVLSPSSFCSVDECTTTNTLTQACRRSTSLLIHDDPDVGLEWKLLKNLIIKTKGPDNLAPHNNCPILRRKFDDAYSEV